MRLITYLALVVAVLFGLVGIAYRALIYLAPPPTQPGTLGGYVFYDPGGWVMGAAVEGLIAGIGTWIVLAGMLAMRRAAGR